MLPPNLLDVSLRTRRCTEELIEWDVLSTVVAVEATVVHLVEIIPPPRTTVPVVSDPSANGAVNDAAEGDGHVNIER